MSSENIELKHKLALEMARARWAMELRAGATARVNITHRVYRDSRGRQRTGYNVFAVDTTHDARDRSAGTPIPLNDHPFWTEEEAQEFAEHALLGRFSVHLRRPTVPIVDGFKLTKVGDK